MIKLWRREIKIEGEVGKDQNCGEGVPHLHVNRTIVSMEERIFTELARH